MRKGAKSKPEFDSSLRGFNVAASRVTCGINKVWDRWSESNVGSDTVFRRLVHSCLLMRILAFASSKSLAPNFTWTARFHSSTIGRQSMQKLFGCFCWLCECCVVVFSMSCRDGDSNSKRCRVEGVVGQSAVMTTFWSKNKNEADLPPMTISVLHCGALSPSCHSIAPSSRWIIK